MTANETLTLNEKVLLAAVAYSGGDVKKTFTAEELLVKVWQGDKHAFGLRGFENEYPDSNKLYTKIDGKGGLVEKGFFEKVGERTLRLTEKGLAYAIDLQPGEEKLQAKLHRGLQEELNRIIGNSEFKAWLGDNTKPKHFRGAGNFWGIAAGTPSKTVKERINAIDSKLRIALDEMEKLKTDRIAEQHGKVLFERNDIERCIEFQEVLKKRFEKELRILGYF